MRKLFISLLLSLCCVIPAVSQSAIGVISFEEDETVLTAQVNKVIDPAEGDDCPLVIIHGATIDGFHFPGAIQTKNGKNEDGEDVIWVYLPCRSSKITIQNRAHKELGELVYQFPSRNLKNGKTYNLTMDIKLPKAIGGKQYLTFAVNPSNATVEVTSEGQAVSDMWSVINGKATREVDPGNYFYRISAPNYHTTTSSVNFDGAEPMTVDVNLRPNFGYLTIKPTDELAGAGIYIDNIFVATGTLTDHLLPSGPHTLKISKELYKTYEKAFDITDDQRLLIEPEMIADFATTSVTTADPEAEIYRDNKLLGKGSWRGPLPKGRYMFETRRQYHKPQQKMVTVESITNPIDIVLEAPEPITGSLSIESQPDGATIKIDGKTMGTTPRSFHDLLIGPHSVNLSKAGYQDVTTRVEVKENDPQRINKTLSNLSAATITCLSYTDLTIDGKTIPNHGGQYSFSAPVGSSHTAKATRDGYTTATRKFTIPASGSITVNLPQKEYLIKKNGGYFDIGVAAPGNLGLYAAVGGYVSGFNIEGSLIYGFQKSREFSFIGTNQDSRTRYTAYELGLRLGYGIPCGTRFMLTPQVGIAGVSVNCVDKVPGTLKNAGILTGTGSLRAYVAISERVGIALIPEYRFKLSAKETINLMADQDSRIKNWIEGFNCKLSFTICF